MDSLSVFFDPPFAWWFVAAVALASGLLAFYGLLRRVRGGWLRLGAWAALTIALCNPVILQQETEPLKSIVAVAVDESDSQKLDGRDDQTAQARSALLELIARFPQFEVREVTVRNGGAEEGDASTAVFSALRNALQDVPPERLAGTIVLSDGQIHDIPKTADGLGNAPVHALITGSEEDRDRRITIERAPRFGIVGESQEIVYRVIDTNIEETGEFIDVRVFVDGEQVSVEQVLPGAESSFVFDVPHGGKTVIEFAAGAVENEITEVNNRAYAVLEGIRENLRVLLVSGEPHAGERTWRNLLKSDASVDLVHFTILRPPEKQDGTPINELSLIAFPTRELFIEKIDEFDLIIFDRYQRRGVLPVLYFDNIARYVEEGGAILIAAGPEYADQSSVFQTPLAPVLPVTPSGTIIEEGYHARLSEDGRKHPVTRDLPGALRPPEQGELPPDAHPDWSRWFRLIDGQTERGDVIMTGPQDKPLLVLDRPGKGRIAMLMSDHVWLWARGFEGGGPHTQLLRRLGHWLMKEPELDEEALRAEARGNVLTVERQTMGDDPGPLSLITPSGETLQLAFERKSDGLWRSEHRARSLGLYRAANGDLRALAHVGPANPREYSEIVSTGEKIRPVADATGGLVQRVSKAAPSSLPRIVPVRGNSTPSGRDWMGLRVTEASLLKGVNRLPLFAGFLGLALLLAAMSVTWAREGR